MLEQRRHERIFLVSLALTSLIAAPGSALGAEDESAVFEKVKAALGSLGYHGSGTSDWHGLMKPVFDRLVFFGEKSTLSYSFTFCHDPSSSRAVWRGPEAPFVTEARRLKERTYTRGDSDSWILWSEPFDVGPNLRSRLSSYHRPERRGAETVRGIHTIHYRADFDIEAVVAQKGAEARAAGGSFTDERENEIRFHATANRIDLFIDENDFPRTVVVRDGSRWMYKEIVIELDPGCDEPIQPPPEDRVHRESPDYDDVRTVTVVFDDERREYRGGACYRLGSLLTYHGRGPGYYLEVGLRGMPSLSTLARPLEEKTGYAHWGWGEDHYRLEVPASGVEVSRDEHSFSIEGEVVTFQRGSEKTKLDPPVSVRVDVDCPGPPDPYEPREPPDSGEH